MLSILVAGVFYLDVGASLHHKNDDFVNSDGQCIENFIGTAEAGYTHKKITIFVSHKSSVQAKDRGLNEIGIKARVIEW